MVAMFSTKAASLVFLSFALAWLLGLPGAFSWSRMAERNAALNYAQDATPTPTLAEQELEINSPAGGESLQGVVSVTGTVRAAHLVSYEVSFAYQSDPTQTWFLIAQGSAPVEQGLLANWDTSTITDGVYRLRVQMYLNDGQVKDIVLYGLRVRNYSPVETSTPAPTGEAPVETVAPVMRATITLTSTPLPDFIAPERAAAPQATNPVTVGANQLAYSAGLGMVVVLAAMTIGLVYFGLKALLRR